MPPLQKQILKFLVPLCHQTAGNALCLTSFTIARDLIGL